MKQVLKNIVLVMLCVQLSFQSTSYAQDNLSKADRYRMLDSLIQQQINSDQAGFKNVVEATEAYFPDKNEMISDILIIRDPDAQNFLENYNEMFWRQLISSDEAGTIYSEGKNLMSAFIRYYEVTGQDKRLGTVEWALIGAGSAIAAAFVVTFGYRYVGLRNRLRARAISNAEKEFQQQFIKLSKEKEGLLQLYQGYHDEFDKAANSEQAIENIIGFQKKRRDTIKASLEHNIDERGNRLSVEDRTNLQKELDVVTQEIEDLKVKKKKVRSTMLKITKRIRNFNFGRWATRIPVVALFFTIGTSMWAQSSTAEKQNVESEYGMGIDQWFLNFMNMPRDLLTNPGYSNSEKNKFYLYLSLVYFIERDSHDGFISDFFMGCMEEGYQPDPLNLQRSLVDIMFVEGEYERFEDARRDMAYEMSTLAARLNQEMDAQQINDHCEPSRN